MKLTHVIVVCLSSLWFSIAQAEEVFEIDTQHTFPSFEVNHLNLSTLRGNFTKTTGKITMDRDTFKGTVEIYIDPNSINVGNIDLTEKVKGKEFLDVKRYPDIVYVGSMSFSLKSPTDISGQFTLHGITKPLALKIDKFNCGIRQNTNQYVCGADASGEFDRSDFGITYGQAEGISTKVNLIIQVEAVRIANDDNKTDIPPAQ